MFLTEEEIKQKPCPQYFPGLLETMRMIHVSKMGDEKGIADALKVVKDAITCCASDCPVWRWRWDTGENGGADRGYCGLGGKP